MGKILVAYASRTGCTREAAEIIGDALRSATCDQVDMLRIREAGDLSGYVAVIVGSAARSKRGWLSEARHWLRDHEVALRGLPVAYFMTCWVLRDDTPEARGQAQGYMALVREKIPAISPVAIGLFPGRLDLKRFSAFDRFWLRMKHAPEGDWFDGDQVRRWAEGLPVLLSRAAHKRSI